MLLRDGRHVDVFVATVALVPSYDRSGLTEDSVHKKDSKLFEKLQLKLTKVRRCPAGSSRVPRRHSCPFPSFLHTRASNIFC